MYLPAIVSVSMYFEKKRAFATGVAVCGSGVGTFLMAPLVHELIDNYGWENAIIIMGGIVVLCAPLGTLYKPVPINNMSVNSDVEVEEQISERENTLDKATNCKSDTNLIYDGIFITFAVSNFLTSFGLNIPYLYTVVSSKVQLMKVINLKHRHCLNRIEPSRWELKKKMQASSSL